MKHLSGLRQMIQLGLVSLLFTTSCAQPLGLQTQTPPLLQRTSSVQISSLQAMTETPLPIQMPSLKAPTISPTAFLESTEMLLTPIPESTLSIDQAKALILGFLQNNGECKLPCVWGLTPGQTDMHALKRFVNRFGNAETSDFSQYNKDYGDLGGLQVIITREDITSNLYLDYYRNTTDVEQLVFGGEPYGHPMTVGKFDSPGFNNLFSYYMLPNILAVYGKPTQILVWSFHQDLGSPYTWFPFTIVLLYEEKGFLIAYTAKREQANDVYIGCPLHSYFVLTSWVPGQEKTWRDAQSKLSGIGLNDGTVDEFRPVREVTSLSVDDFYRKFKDTNNKDCLSTPISLWQR